MALEDFVQGGNICNFAATPPGTRVRFVSYLATDALLGVRTAFPGVPPPLSPWAQYPRWSPIPLCFRFLGVRHRDPAFWRDMTWQIFPDPDGHFEIVLAGRDFFLCFYQRSALAFLNDESTRFMPIDPSFRRFRVDWVKGAQTWFILGNLAGDYVVDVYGGQAGVFPAENQPVGRYRRNSNENQIWRAEYVGPPY
jgi:hypothetical protein